MVLTREGTLGVFGRDAKDTVSRRTLNFTAFQCVAMLYLDMHVCR